jgi:hypothetical protein
MGNTSQRCSLCSAPEGVRVYVESQVKAHRKLRDLEREVSFSKSTISKHMRRCIPKAQAHEHRHRMHIAHDALIFVLWPNGRVTCDSQTLDASAALAMLDPNRDVLIEVQFEEVPIRNYSWLIEQAHHEMEQDLSSRKLTPGSSDPA